MPAAYWKIVIGQGETWRMVLRLRNPTPPGGALDLTGYVARMQIRENLDSVAPLYSLTSAASGGITIDPLVGVIALNIADDITAAWLWRYGLYDLEIESAGGETTRLLKGEVEISFEVTR